MKNKTPLKFYAEQSTYVPGDGYTTGWLPLTTNVNLIGEAQDIDVFWAEWQSAYGNQVLEAQAVGVNEMATIRMTYIPALFDALRTNKVVISKNADNIIKDNIPDKDNPNAYSMLGGVDNFKEQNEWMEFKVRRYEAK